MMTAHLALLCPRHQGGAVEPLVHLLHARNGAHRVGAGLGSSEEAVERAVLPPLGRVHLHVADHRAGDGASMKSR